MLLGAVGIICGLSVLFKKEALLMYHVWGFALLCNAIITISLDSDIMAETIGNIITGVGVLLYFNLIALGKFKLNLTAKKWLLGLLVALLIAVLPVIAFWHWAY